MARSSSTLRRSTSATRPAVCRPPYFTALSLWPHDSAWNGGGLFENERTLLLNSGSRVPPCAAGFAAPPPSALEVRPLGGPHGEDDTVQHPRLLRDGWSLLEAGRSMHRPDGDPHFVFDPPRVYLLPQRSKGSALLHRIVRGLGSVNGPWYIEEFRVEHPKPGRTTTLKDAEWADWDRNGDLLFARRGQLFRIRSQELHRGMERAVALADFAPRTFTNLEPPPTASRW